MPIIEGADLTSIDTSFKNYPEGSYTVLVKEVTFWRGKDASDARHGTQVRVVTEIVDNDADPKNNGKPFTHFINFRDENGELNRYGLADIKRYLEAIYGKGSPQVGRGDTDDIAGNTVLLYLNERADKNDPSKMYQNVKKILPAA